MDFQLLVRKPVRGPLTRANKTISLPRLASGLTLRAVGAGSGILVFVVVVLVVVVVVVVVYWLLVVLR